MEDSELQHCLLSLVVSRGLAGAADLETPIPSPADLAAGITRAAMPDGYVTLRELVAYLELQQEAFPFLRQKKYAIKGEIGKDEVIIAKHGYPLD